MDSEQLHHMSLLAQLHEARRDYFKAVEVLTAIGHVTISPSVSQDARPDRVQSLQQAMVFVRSFFTLSLRVAQEGAANTVRTR
jgi:hypothetical protein